MKSWWRAVVTDPTTWIAAALLAIGVWIVIAIAEPTGGSLLLLLALVLIALIAWPMSLLMTGRLNARRFVVPAPAELDEQALARLAEELDDLDDDQPREQLVALRQKRASMMKVLERRLDAGELTYARYLGSAQQVFDAAVDNLHEVAVAHHSMASIDESYIERRLAELDRVEEPDESSARERETLDQRRQLRVAQQKKIGRLIAQNEAALTSLDRTSTALADVPIGKRPEDADAAMEALEELAARAERYAT